MRLYKISCQLLLTTCLLTWPLRGQDDAPFTRLFDTSSADRLPVTEETVAKRTGWQLIPEDKTNHLFTGDAVLLNDKLAVVVRKGLQGPEVFAKTASGWKRRALIGHDEKLAGLTDKVGDVKIIENTGSAVIIEAQFIGASTTALRFRLTTGEAILEIRPGENAGYVIMQSKARYVVVPDYFGDDMVYDAAPSLQPSHPVGEREKARCLPTENFCLSLLEGGDAMIMSVWQASEQDAWLGEADSRIHCLKGKSLWLAFLESPGLWRAGALGEAWKPPFPAKWRCSFVRDQSVADSWEFERGPQPGQTAGTHQGPLVIYPIDRSAATPLTVACPTDVMRNTLGVGPCQYILACEGMSAQGDPTPNSVMNWVEKQFEQKKQRKAADDIRERLDSMSEHIAQAQARLKQYGECATQLRKQLANQPGSAAAAAAAFMTLVDNLDRCATIGLGPTASPEQAKRLAGEVAALIGQDDALAACQKLGGQLRAIGEAQDRALATCRMAVRRLRAQGQTMALNQPRDSDLALEIQKLAEQKLRNK